jgi:hypothetical protein
MDENLRHGNENDWIENEYYELCNSLMGLNLFHVDYFMPTPLPL